MMTAEIIKQLLEATLGLVATFNAMSPGIKIEAKVVYCDPEPAGYECTTDSSTIAHDK